MRRAKGGLIQATGSIVLFFVLNLGPGWGEQTATVVTNDPVSFAQGTARITRPVQPEEVFLVIATAGDEVTIADRQGFQATLNRNALKITDSIPAAANTNSAPVLPANSVTAPPAPTSPPFISSPSPAPPASTSAAAPTDLSPEDADRVKRLNDAFQMPLFNNANLWGDDIIDVAYRLKWPQESSTATDASYRRYALKTGASVLGTRAYSMALYGRNGYPTYISIVFANKGDFPEMMVLEKKTFDHVTIPQEESEKAFKDLNAAVKSDADTINAQLTAILGPPETHQFGPTANSRETVHRWDWKGHAILFSAPHDEYAAIKIVPSEVADHFGDVAHMDRDAIKAELSKRVLKKDNGDVILQQIPMVDQGPKGYCVPATWERYLRYVDVPADMYVLAMLGNTGVGGTNIGAIRAGVNDYVGSYGRRIENANVPLDVSHIGRFIDQGLPLMWTCYVLKDVEKNINLHTAQRKTVTDWADYKAKVQEDDKPLVFDDPNRRFYGHMRMIVGYNAQTDELAISDSWGEQYAVRWMSVKEGQGITQNDLEYIQW